MGEAPEQERRGMLTGGIIVLGIGVVFLLERLHIIPHIGDMWPLFPIIVGIALIVGGLRRGGTRDRSRYSHRHDAGVPPAPERQEAAPPRDEPVGAASREAEEEAYREGSRRDSERHDPARRGPGNA